jgi:Zn-finger nucleic acid-binding protein
MECPRDHSKLARKVSERMFGDCCKACGGIYLSSKGVAAFKHNFETQILEKIVNETLKDNSNLHCPHCKMAMKTTTIDGIELDICGNCSGIWFDKYEAEEIIDKYAGISGGEYLTASIIPFPFNLIYFFSKWFDKDSKNKKLDSK